MKIAKFILLAFPIVLASALMLALPAAASIVNAPAKAQVTLVSTQLIPQSVTPLTQESNPIKDQLGCNCPSCVQANSQLLQGKLPFAGI
ncbi:hypothetical protein NIES4075_58320 [Tolypothrix sp. NIES-4075]|uniref:hypothetical protein n=1 Tax=Tolypothrix sp. NIES-4075 TaxID=2005459 RepID=UPI000B5C5F7D|nr:hypothetical protein [Tolypothrix sp. NIES-4075]GAX44813.1 hypothetical protein NIES4075_58320 [Tolypothrix sp. NIES-4075]